MIKGVLFLCTGNSIRSQMAETLTKSLAPQELKVWSAGVSPSSIHPLSELMMEEEGLSMRGQFSKGLKDIPLGEIDYVITLCGYAESVCPQEILKKGQHEHWPIQDPIGFRGGNAVLVARFRETKADLQARIEDWLKRITTE